MIGERVRVSLSPELVARLMLRAADALRGLLPLQESARAAGSCPGVAGSGGEDTEARGGGNGPPRRPRTRVHGSAVGREAPLSCVERMEAILCRVSTVRLLHRVGQERAALCAAVGCSRRDPG